MALAVVSRMAPELRLLRWPADTSVKHAAVVWQWQDDTGAWLPFSASVQAVLQNAFDDYCCPTRCACSGYTFERGAVTYRIDFTTMRQRNLGTGFERAVRRASHDNGLSVGCVVSSMLDMPGFGDMEMGAFTKQVFVEDPADDTAECSICSQASATDDPVLMTRKCGHLFHASCLRTWVGINPVCAVCRAALFTIKVGTQPNGTMSVDISPPGMRCIGGRMDVAVIKVEYEVLPFEDSKGVKYDGTRRTAYMPDTPEYRAVTDLLALAFHRRLVFGLGDSATTGAQNVVVWNIHHRTSLKPGPYGWPDDGYAGRVLSELLAVLPDVEAASLAAAPVDAAGAPVDVDMT
jgi:hypothetical protein